MATAPTTERRFEDAIEAHLLAHGWERGDPANYDAQRALDPSFLIPFIQKTQEKTWKAIEALHKANTAACLIDDLCRTLASQGMLNVLRHGFKCTGKTVRGGIFRPRQPHEPRD